MTLSFLAAARAIALKAPAGIRTCSFKFIVLAQEFEYDGAVAG